MASPSSSTPKSSNTVTHGIDKSASKKKQVGSNYAWLLVPALLALLVSGTIHYVITLKEQANTLDEENSALKNHIQNMIQQVLVERELFEKDIEMYRSYLAQHISSTSNNTSASFTEVPRVANLSFRDFYEQYALQGKPVIIEGYGNRLFSGSPWNISTFERTCGDVEVTLKQRDNNADTWGALVNGPTVKLSSWIAQVVNHTANESYHVFDWSLPSGCPEVVDNFIVPKYFSSDFFMRVAANRSGMFRRSWPSLFISPKNSSSQLHIDNMGTNFWMYVISGRKKWRFFPKGDIPLLYKNVLSPRFGVDAFDLDYEKFPLLKLTSPIECVLEAGDLLYVPGGSPHQVTNLEDIVAISMNYVDGSNFDMVKEQLIEAIKFRSHQYTPLYNEFIRTDFPAIIDLDNQEDLPYDKYVYQIISGFESYYANEEVATNETLSE